MDSISQAAQRTAPPAQALVLAVALPPFRAAQGWITTFPHHTLQGWKIRAGHGSFLTPALTPPCTLGPAGMGEMDKAQFPEVSAISKCKNAAFCLLRSSGGWL